MITEDGRLVCDNCGDEFPPLKKDPRVNLSLAGGIVLTDRTGLKTVIWQFCDEMCFAAWLESPAKREIWPSM